MEGLLCSKSLPPGFRFHPTDEELFMYYLKRKLLEKSLSPELIADVAVYRFAPWELPPMSSLKTRDLNWYFFCPRAKKYPNGGRANRATVHGYWKSTSNDRMMMYSLRPVGKIKTLIFHRGKAPKGERTEWVMHEYRLEDKVLAEKGVPQESYVICKIYEKSGFGPRNGEHYGARFVEEDWDSDDDENVQERGPELVPADMGPGLVGDSPDGSISVLTYTMASPNVAPPVNFPTAIATAPVADVTFPNTMVAFVGTPFTVSGGTLNITHGYVASACGFTCAMGFPNTATYTAAGASDEDDLDRLLSYFTEEMDDGSDFFNDLGDLGNLSGQIDLDWSNFSFIEIDGLKYYIVMPYST